MFMWGCSLVAMTPMCVSFRHRRNWNATIVMNTKGSTIPCCEFLFLLLPPTIFSSSFHFSLWHFFYFIYQLHFYCTTLHILPHTHYHCTYNIWMYIQYKHCFHFIYNGYLSFHSPAHHPLVPHAQIRLQICGHESHASVHQNCGKLEQHNCHWHKEQGFTYSTFLLFLVTMGPLYSLCWSANATQLV